MTDSLSLRGVSKAYEDFALQNVSFSLPAGCIMGLIGENGAGKTTTIKLMLNLISRDAGEITILGLDSLKEERKIKEQTGVVFDECCFHPMLTPEDIGRVLRPCYRQWDASLYAKLLKNWAIPKKKKIKDLSRGMKAKLSIAAAMAHHPRLLILDEATSGLDPIMRGDVLDTFQDFISDEEHSVLLSSHITSDLDRIADYITFLHKGRVVLCEDKDRLLSTYGIFKCGAEQLERLPKEYVAGIRRSPYGCEVLVRDAGAVRRAYPGAVIDQPTLEEIMTLTIKGE